MPILWRYLIFDFLKMTFFCVLAFVAILLTMRFDEIAHFTGLGASLNVILLFTFYQIPYILPIAIPLSCLIASFLLIQRLSTTHELVALRACGCALHDILSPLLLTAAFLGLMNFWLISELATYSHLKTNLLKSQFRSINPLLLLHNRHLMRMKGFYFDSLGDTYTGESAADVILAIPNKHQGQINLLIAKQLKVQPGLFVGDQVTLITGKSQESPESFDDLLIENMQQAVTQIEDLADLLQKKVWTINNDYLQLPLLLSRAQEQRHLLKEAKQLRFAHHQIKPLQIHLNRSVSEIVKRLSIAIAVFSFTLMGMAFGFTISRQQTRRPLFFLVALTTFYLVTFFVAKGVDGHRLLSTSLYLVPHLVIIGASIFTLKRVSQGIESC